MQLPTSTFAQLAGAWEHFLTFAMLLVTLVTRHAFSLKLICGRHEGPRLPRASGGTCKYLLVEANV